MSQDSQDPIIGRLIDNRYRVLSRIARGGMATVYLATDERLDRKVAIKVMHSHLTDDANFKERFIREARSAARLAHPNVVSVFDQGQDSEMAYLIMEYLPGITLRELLDEHKQLTAEQTMDIMEAALAGLAAAHSAGIVHRDIKPENVLLADDGRIKLSDFGLARPAAAATATDQALLGTIAYLSPELVTRGVADVRSDIYAVGIMLYEMLTGEQPFKGEQPMQIAYQHANDSVPEPSLKNPQVPAELDELVLWATAKDPESRPSDAREMLRALRDARAIVAPNTADWSGVTTVLEPATDYGISNTQPTVTLSRQATAPVVQAKQHSAPTSTGVLETRSVKRNRNGKILFLLVTVLAILGGTAGWYFGSGPGSYVSVPDFYNADPTIAQTELTELDLLVDIQNRFDYKTEAGKISATDPVANTHVQRGSTITIWVSKGAEPKPVPGLVNMPAAEAEDTILRAGFLLGDVTKEFSAEVERGLIIQMLDASGNALTEGQEILEMQPIQLVVSSGALPAVADLAYETAVARLAEVNLTAARGTEVYHETIEAGRVIGYETDGTVREGDTTVLQISKGPEPVEVPNVIGKTWLEAKKILEEKGFRLDYNAGIDLFPSYATVSSVTPDVGTSHPKGTTLKISFKVF